MIYLEIIHVRLSSEVPVVVIEELIRSLQNESRVIEVRVFRNIRFNTDFSVHLYYESKDNVKKFSPPGSMLASALSEYGMIDHSQWTETLAIPEDCKDE